MWGCTTLYQWRKVAQVLVVWLYPHGSQEQTPICAENFGKIPKGARENEPPHWHCSTTNFTLFDNFLLILKQQSVKVDYYFCCWKCEGVTAFSVWQTDSGIEYGHNMHRLSSQYAQNMLIMWKWMMIEYASIVTFGDIILSRICSYCDSMCSYHDLIDNAKICLDSYLHTYIL